ncbi:MAG: small subunit ribosomal protein [Acidimicrobiaceae bacterium]|nr:small subunit ribosomal protein [Acidimicrobiaceae bacterium]
MAVVTMKQLLEAGVHFGHQTRRWNPKMKRFIFGERNGIYIIDLNQTLEQIDLAYSFVRDLVAAGGTVLSVGTKKQTQDPIARYADQSGMPYINERWLGGMLTNFTTISGRVKKMQEYERMKVAGDFEAMPKKEALILSRELEKLARNLGGIRHMTRLPDAVFIIDTKKEHIAVTEANKLGIPIVAVVDTNCDPDLIQYVIPGNDDAIRAGTLMCRVIADAVEEGRFIASRRAARSSAAAAGPSVQDAAEEARRSEQQREARRQAAVQAQEREARLAASRRQSDAHQARVEGAPDPTDEPTTPGPAPAAAPAAGSVPAPSSDADGADAAVGVDAVTEVPTAEDTPAATPEPAPEPATAEPAATAQPAATAPETDAAAAEATPATAATPSESSTPIDTSTTQE